MTREETINKVQGYLTDYLPIEDYEELDEIIKALKQEPCEDAISRQAVLNTLDNMDSVLDEDRTVETYKELLTVCYNDLPPVMPVRKKEWIPVTERLPEMPFGCLVTVEEDGRNGEPQNVLYSEPVGYDGETWNRADGEPISFEVVAWMPLPEPYRAEMESEEE